MTKLVVIKNNQVVVSSRQVAEKFGKEHKHVLDSVREILKAENSAVRFFQENMYKVEGNNKSYPEYLMNRDGFTLLAMGFTGKEALQWKLKYIAAFNEMEQALNSKPVSALKAKEVEARLNNSRARVASTFLKVAQMTDLLEYKHICQQKAAEVLSGVPLLPMQSINENTLSADEVGRELGISGNMVGRIANQHNLKTAEYGKYFYDKSRHCQKQVETFRYYRKVIPVIQSIIDNKKVGA
ncbi:Rha family transcriptional regulator [Phascolarctobacterium faecium]|uniref:Rha family transcriptional regulator n=1 Tax=Phascolarctobacterium faecium TaxID=33025 RepID=UPI0024310352|nr:Rha family transcriptional regulator [Phascolarctobacterium faecium]